ncbi:helix-turn-helix domain-containing protein [Kordiimonas sp.]|uniref:helix-turn-helix domain-containing protein n=1 Tax=Kordiimonas sp. TaxID=1970157 RepID=UPI003A92F514
MKAQENLDIGQVAKRSGLPASTLRYYEEKGLIRAIGRHGLRRVFSAGVVDQLALITLGRNAGFSLDEIGGMFAARPLMEIDRAALRTKADELEVKIKQLSAVRDGLRHAADCKAPSHLECPTFRRFMQLATKRNKARKGPRRTA